MATLSNIKGRRLIQFVDATGKRRTLGLGRITDRSARLILSHIEQLQAAAALKQAPPMDTVRWMADISDALHAKLAKLNLIAPRTDRDELQIGNYFDSYVKRRTDLKQTTVNKFKATRAAVVNYFTSERSMSSITESEVADWHRKMRETFATATVAMFTKKTRQVYADAVKRKLIAENPFLGVKAGSFTNEARQIYIPQVDIVKVIEACPDHEWRLLFAMARFQGLRIPSETRTLKWSDVLWNQNKLIITAPKTEHHENKGIRIVPIFPETMSYLLETYSLAEHGAKHVFAKLRGENLATTGDKIIKRAGLEPWAKTYQNLRASCETDLVRRFPLHVACKWIGNSAAIAKAHYLIVTDEDFAKASQRAAAGAADSVGQDRTSTGHGEENPQISRGFTNSDCPRRESNSTLEPVENLQNAHLALQQALRQLSSAAPAIRRNLIGKLERALADRRPHAR